MEGVNFFVNVTQLFVLHHTRLLLSSDAQMNIAMLSRSRLSYHVAQLLIQDESLIGNVNADLDTHNLFGTPLYVLRVNNFQNDDHCEIWTKFKMGYSVI